MTVTPQDISFSQFCVAVMRETRMVDETGGLTPVQAQIAQYIENGPKRRVISAFRGCGKSTLASMLVLFKLYQNPDEKVLIISASMSRSEAMSAWILKTIVDIPWLRHMQPDSHDGRYSRIAFDVGSCKYIEQSPSVRAAGITGQITGSRASFILVDDCETPQTCLTQVQREKLRNSLNELESILKPTPEADIVYLGTPHSSTDSIYFALKRDLGYSARTWPARVPETATPYNGCLASWIEDRIGVASGRPTDTRFSEDELLQRELSMSPMQWKLQFMLDPTLSDIERYPLRVGDAMVLSIDQHVPEVVVYDKAKDLALDDLPCCGLAHDPRFYRPRTIEGQIPATDVPTVMALDPSGGGADEFAYSVVKAYAGNYYLVDSGGKLGGVNDQWWRELASIAKKHKVNEILVESNFGGLEVYKQVLSPYLVKAGAECRIEPIRSNQRKELRIIDTLAPLLQTHRIVIDRRVVERDAEILKSADEKSAAYSLFWQMTRLTHDRGSLIHDDRLDSWAMALAWFQEQAAQDQMQQQAARHGEWLEAMLGDEIETALLSVDRLALGMTVEQARAASGGASWI